MSESGDSDIQIGDTQGEQTPLANSGPLVSVNVDNMEVSRADENENEPEPGDQENNRRPRNRRVDLAIHEQTTAGGNAFIDGVLWEDTARRRKRMTGPTRMKTAPVTSQEMNMRHSGVSAPTSRVQGIPVARQNRNIKIEHVAVCGLCQGKSMDEMWLQGGNLQILGRIENIIIQRASRFECLCSMYYLLTFTLVTNQRFIVKQLWKFCCCNIQTEEESHHFSDLQHLKVERGLSVRQIRNSILITGILYILFQLSLGLIYGTPVIQYSIGLIAFSYGITSLIAFLYYYNVNFLVVDVAKTNVVGSRTWSLETVIRGRSYMTIRVPFPVDACFEVMNELIKKHPSLLPVEADI